MVSYIEKKMLCVCVRKYVIRNAKNLASAPLSIPFSPLLSFSRTCLRRTLYACENLCNKKCEKIWLARSLSCFPPSPFLLFSSKKNFVCVRENVCRKK